MTPLWLLDVDGVLNALGDPRDGGWPTVRQGSAQALGRWWPITWSPELVDAVRAIADEGVVEIRWLTTWEDAAATSLSALLVLPPYPVAGRHGGPRGFLRTRARARSAWWKLEVAQTVLDGDPGRPLVWTDDDLAYEPAAQAWAGRRAGPTMLVAPDLRTGISRAEMSRIEEFCRSGRGGS